MLKKILVAAALVTVIAAPAFAQSSDPDAGTGNVLPFAYAPTDHSGNGAYAQAAPTARQTSKVGNKARGNGAYVQAVPSVSR